jgi:hypothetical protein
LQNLDLRQAKFLKQDRHFRALKGRPDPRVTKYRG